MIILQILPELKSGGVERGTVDLAKYLTRNGHTAIVVSAGGPLVNDLTSAGVKHYRLPVHAKSPWAIWRSVKTLVKIVRLEKVDVIHARSRVPPSWPSSSAAARRCRSSRPVMDSTASIS
ncbi:MAG: glycosyltransferase [Candidatus Eisenbacteria bacterium]|nr:glycosyltransferase [Candidatus Eisenbacteria bacterium]